MEKEHRKLLKTGEYTYMITLPKEWVKKLKMRAKRNVEMVLKKDKIVIQRVSK